MSKIAKKKPRSKAQDGQVAGSEDVMIAGVSLAERLERMERVRKEAMRSKKAALKFLIGTGLYDKRGNLKKKFR